MKVIIKGLVLLVITTQSLMQSWTFNIFDSNNNKFNLPTSFEASFKIYQLIGSSLSTNPVKAYVFRQSIDLNKEYFQESVDVAGVLEIKKYENLDYSTGDSTTYMVKNNKCHSANIEMDKTLTEQITTLNDPFGDALVDYVGQATPSWDTVSTGNQFYRFKYTDVYGNNAYRFYDKDTGLLKYHQYSFEGTDFVTDYETIEEKTFIASELDISSCPARI
ncbi:UNKNOWN [Stylonychia lemnae]|uniref:Uncharacterized protein n=1 Tax=Stylonychia lemnae TaxID=5949 RepID=A0A077ZTK6_STYLE|nr:UNKNOWN [Stylonychia lemnae]|eukprot:CDW73248.1 UNKNOWN [Stylonychia lemnae]